MFSIGTSLRVEPSVSESPLVSIAFMGFFMICVSVLDYSER